jgi:hypothetical protein
MDPRVASLQTPKDCEAFARNAIARDRDDLAIEAGQREVELRAISYGACSDVERECIEAVYAYERVLAEKNGKRTPASRTWDMIKRRGIIAAVERIVDRPVVTVAFDVLKKAGLARFAFEAVIARHPEVFSESAVRRSRERMRHDANESSLSS